MKNYQFSEITEQTTKSKHRVHDIIVAKDLRSFTIRTSHTVQSICMTIVPLSSMVFEFLFFFLHKSCVACLTKLHSSAAGWDDRFKFQFNSFYSKRLILTKFWMVGHFREFQFVISRNKLNPNDSQ